MPMKEKPSANAACPVLPLAVNGSRTLPPVEPERLGYGRNGLSLYLNMAKAQCSFLN
jgi:hypothetical protein